MKQVLPVIAGCQEQYDKYFPSFSYFKLFFKIRETIEINICHIVRSCRALTSFLLAHKMYLI